MSMKESKEQDTSRKNYIEKSLSLKVHASHSNSHISTQVTTQFHLSSIYQLIFQHQLHITIEVIKLSQSALSNILSWRPFTHINIRRWSISNFSWFMSHQFHSLLMLLLNKQSTWAHVVAWIRDNVASPLTLTKTSSIQMKLRMPTWWSIIPSLS